MDTETQRYSYPDEVKQGALLFRTEQAYISAPLLHTDVQIEITGMIARTAVKHYFRNPNSHWQEGIYVFPLPETAAVDHMRMQIGERVIEGQIKERRAARKEYEKARQNGNRASLVEQERPNIFTTSVANIGPHQTIIVEIEYQQVVGYSQGNFSLRFPMVVGPRYIPGNNQVNGAAGSGWAENTSQVADAKRITPPVLLPTQDKMNPVSLNINLDAGFKLARIESPYHAVEIYNRTQNNYQVVLKDDEVPADRDFLLEWQPVPGNAPMAAFFKEAKDNSDYALLMVLPPGNKSRKTLAREVIFVIDTSGSMAGPSITQAKSALEMALGRLRAGDRFNIIQFNSKTSQLFQFPRPVAHASIREARKYIRALEADGGTEMAPALRAALTNHGNGYDVRQVVFLTDGSVGNEDELFQIIEQRLGESRLFTVGIGSAPNSHFMNRASRFGRGTHTYIGNTKEVQRKMDELFQKLENPVLSDINIQWPDGENIESWPQKIPDLYLGEPLLITVKADALPQHALISGNAPERAWHTKLALDGGQNRQGISVLWARRKIAALMDQQRRDETEADAIRDQVVEVALAHHLVSKYTSLIAVDVTPARPQDEALHQRPMPTNLPAGWRYEKVFGQMPATATPAALYIILGMILLILTRLLTLIGKDATNF